MSYMDNTLARDSRAADTYEGIHNALIAHTSSSHLIIPPTRPPTSHLKIPPQAAITLLAVEELFLGASPANATALAVPEAGILISVEKGTLAAGVTAKRVGTVQAEAPSRYVLEVVTLIAANGLYRASVKLMVCILQRKVKAAEGTTLKCTSLRKLRSFHIFTVI
jgi:hypothetical protein